LVVCLAPGAVEGERCELSACRRVLFIGKWLPWQGSIRESRPGSRIHHFLPWHK
jgi:hypothetical protein